MVGGPNQGNSFPNTPIPMGAFTQDFEYAEGHGDLDECNGRFGVTPEFPNGIYYYVVTDDFPFFTRCLKGEISVNGGGGGIINCEDVPPGANVVAIISVVDPKILLIVLRIVKL